MVGKRGKPGNHRLPNESSISPPAAGGAHLGWSKDGAPRSDPRWPNHL